MKKNNFNNSDNINSYADIMINRIMACVEEKLKDVPKIKSAFVESVNLDGTVNITLPSDDKIYTRIQNRSNQSDIIPGDMVKILLENGSFSNCWILATYPRKEKKVNDFVENNIGT